MAALGDTITTKVYVDDVPYEITDTRNEGESTGDFVNRHFTHVRSFLRDSGVT